MRRLRARGAAVVVAAVAPFLHGANARLAAQDLVVIETSRGDITAPDTGRSQFFVCIGDQPSLDFGGHRNLDGQGFAVFGRVVEGMDVVRAIQAGAVEAQRLVVPIEIERIRRAGRTVPAGRYP